jgi:4-amino-4-deoxy-L-arabinose transferase-like glycosyltransferase
MLAIVATLASIVLLAVFATRHFASARAGVIAAVLFAAMPVVWLAVGGGATQVVLLPFSIASLLCFDVFHRGGNWTWLVLAGAALAQMLYWHLAGVVLAPVYLALGSLILLPGRDRIMTVGALTAGFALVSLPWAVGLLRDPRWLTESINAYGLYDANRFNLLQGMREITSWTGLTVRSEMYWDSFNPALLFLGSGGLWQSLIGSRVFLLPFAVPLVRGLVAYVLYPRDAMDWLVIGTFVSAPVAAALIAAPNAPRLILLAPAAAIIATRGCYPGAFRITAAGSPATPAMAVTKP